MKVSELKKIVDDYIKSHSVDDEVMLLYDICWWDKTKRVIEPMKEKHIKPTKIAECEETVVLKCAYSDECIPPSGVDFEDCANCPEGGTRIRTKLVEAKKFGKDVLGIHAY